MSLEKIQQVDVFYVLELLLKHMKKSQKNYIYSTERRKIKDEKNIVDIWKVISKFYQINLIIIKNIS